MSVKYVRHESVRVSSFKSWHFPNIDYDKLVAAGFYYDNNGDEVICFCCGVRISGWQNTNHAFMIVFTIMSISKRKRFIY